MVSVDDYVRAAYPVLLALAPSFTNNDPRCAELPGTFDDCDERDKEFLRELVRAGLADGGITLREGA